MQFSKATKSTSLTLISLELQEAVLRKTIVKPALLFTPENHMLCVSHS